MQCVTMTVYRVGSVTEKEPNPLLPSRLSAANEVATLHSQDTKAEAYIEKLTTALGCTSEMKQTNQVEEIFSNFFEKKIKLNFFIFSSETFFYVLEHFETIRRNSQERGASVRRSLGNCRFWIYALVFKIITFLCLVSAQPLTIGLQDGR